MRKLFLYSTDYHIGRVISSGILLETYGKSPTYIKS